MGTLNKTISFDVDLFTEATQGTDNISKRINDLVAKGISYEKQAEPKYIVDTLFNTVRELIRLRDNKEIKISLIKKEPIKIEHDYVNERN